MVCLSQRNCLNFLQYLPTTRVHLQRRQWHPTPVLLPGESHDRRSLVGCSPCGLKESDTTERLHFHFSVSCIGEGNGNTLQCACLENPRDGGAWWTAVDGVAQSRTQLKWLSSSSSRVHLAINRSPWHFNYSKSPTYEQVPFWQQVCKSKKVSLRYPKNTVSYIVVYCNRFIILF